LANLPLPRTDLLFLGATNHQKKLVNQEDTFLTIKNTAQGLYKEKGSKFLAFAYPVADEREVKYHLEELRKIYHDARHHCYAYMIGVNQEVYRTNDDGEPNHSAGDPILGQIRSHKLTNVLIVVVRYFGGTKLGVGGLIAAYKTAAAEALGQAEIITDIVQHDALVKFPYDLMNEVMKLVKDYDFEIKAQDFDLSCTLHIRIRASLVQEAESKFSKIDGVLFVID
jgi:uncharacterized YigZ family protein